MSSANWHAESDPSEEETNHESPAARKRSSRACDQCRKTKSKCEPSPSTLGTCKSCALTGNTCTFLGPSYKRGPPKGYIQAIEQRWHQVESLLGAVIACSDPRVQDIVSELQQDDLAREILHRVDVGPFGPSGRLHQPVGATKEEFFASIFRSNEASTRDLARSRRQSRVSREIVSSARDDGLCTVPTAEWQDRLSARLASAGSMSGIRPHGLPAPFQGISFHSPTLDPQGAPPSQRRRLNTCSGTGPSQGYPDWNDMYTMDALSDSEGTDESNDPTDAFGQLSLDENREVRYHGKASGLHLLGRSDRVDDRHEGGIWHLPMARVWPPAKNYLAHLLPEEDLHVQLPSVALQDHLVELYFIYVHPIFPVIHKGRKYSSNPTTPEFSGDISTFSPKLEPSQTVTKLLLLAIYAIAARYSDDSPPPVGKMWEVGCDYLIEARTLLTKVFHSSRASTCQALLLLGHREFGIGSMEQGWLYIGMAIRMAQDLGLNRAADKWQLNGSDLFSYEEKQIRKQIWWACCVADKSVNVLFYNSLANCCKGTDMGRPACIGETDFDTPFPEIDQDDEELWQIRPSDPEYSHYSSTPSRVMSCFRAAASLSVIVGSIVNLVYPVRPIARVSRRTILANLETRLDQWYIDLPNSLRYDTASKRNTPPPPVLFLHVQYWSAVLLLHRAFIPNWKGSEQLLHNSSTDSDTASLKAFDLCQSAATYVSTIVTTYHENFNLQRSSPFLTSYLLSAGIMHVVTLTLRTSNVQACIGLRQCLTALKELEIIWPSAARAWDLLHGVKVQVDSNLTPLIPGPDRRKRPADDAFGKEKSSDFLQREAFGNLEEKELPAPQIVNGIQDMSTRMMAHMLGLDIPGIEPSTSYYPGYEWWPRTNSPQTYMQIPIPLSGAAPSALVSYVTQNQSDWRNSATIPSYSFDFQDVTQPASGH
ncbi:hypothetical protein SERLA73DRAFT_80157 [Serpula lacrymans var. lacrymans S7.3]|uniref:Zn(2)-C6 fungal-type domain-containing protein n=2 Tax=Serpula lacrymans var. lacrymans TaxID=341189 RepID=F8QIW7_SERL3|nr:uncharacterized protein SERLADRAFT_431767 [Serpula lacrymans var. lacrymans S7.9]EGN91754.1 hypothetical protein SERLA73DRAFT_80157 [Serpula lacrymans var. lacrymans S7.3]EGO30267.1 hypothetical protein SERLADRAFT_431767 [Serpula lacrymans var. lacrymans S7.9]